uniref:Plastocyanin-like domain-containing protein n=1 Tax=Poecilia latipinna TaxID=48699 RepID=A0A3B3ULM2_9TELE
MEANWYMSPSPGNIFVGKGENRIGSRYKKVAYREYTDETFKTQKAREEHLSILGPIIHGEVGEQILIVFKNKASRPYSITPHGVKASENIRRKKIISRSCCSLTKTLKFKKKDQIYFQYVYLITQESNG